MHRYVNIAQMMNPGVYDPELWMPPSFREFVAHETLPSVPPDGYTNNDEPP